MKRLLPQQQLSDVFGIENTYLRVKNLGSGTQLVVMQTRDSLLMIALVDLLIPAKREKTANGTSTPRLPEGESETCITNR